VSGYFFCQVFTAAPDAVAHLTQRLCDVRIDGIPSRYTVWAALLDRLVAEENSPALIMRAIELAHEVILPGAVPFGYEMIYSSRLKQSKPLPGMFSAVLGRQSPFTLKRVRTGISGTRCDTTYRAITP